MYQSPGFADLSRIALEPAMPTETPALPPLPSLPVAPIEAMDSAPREPEPRAAASPAVAWPAHVPWSVAWRSWLSLLLLAGVGGWLLSNAEHLSPYAMAVIGISAAALVAWTVMRWDEATVAIVAALALVAAGVIEPEKMYSALGNDLIWLMLGGFVLAAVIRGCGLAERWSLVLASRARTPMGLLWRLTGLIGVTAFLIPSTSGRAALLLPVFLALLPSLPTPGLARAVGLLFPTIILLSAGASLLGAGAHLVAVDFLRHLGLPALGFVQWMLWAAPLSILACAGATALIGTVFMRGKDRRVRLSISAPPRVPMTRHQRAIALITAATVLAWATTAWHGLDAAIVAIGGALAATLKPLTGVDLKGSLKKVEWNLLLFLAAATVLAEALISSNVAHDAAQAALRVAPDAWSQPSAVLMLVAAIALLSHLVITSRTARASVLLAVVVAPLIELGLDPLLLVLLVVLGSGFCQTLTVSAKPVAVFASQDAHRIAPGDLLTLSAVLLPLMLGLLAFFGLYVWPAQMLAFGWSA
jgi:di/tricarboxylate transporter